MIVGSAVDFCLLRLPGLDGEGGPGGAGDTCGIARPARERECVAGLDGTDFTCAAMNTMDGQGDADIPYIDGYHNK